MKKFLIKWKLKLIKSIENKDRKNDLIFNNCSFTL